MCDFSLLKFTNYLILLLFIQRINTLEKEGCDHPGLPINGESFPDKAEYLEGEDLSFSCSPSYILTGPQKIKCLGYSTWSQNIPVCAKNLAYQKSPQCLRQDPGSVNETLTSLLMDGDPHTCHKVSLAKELKLAIWLQQETDISNIYVYMKNLTDSQQMPQIKAVYSSGYTNDYFEAECFLTNKGMDVELKVFECKNKENYFMTEEAQLIFSSSEKINMMLCDIMSFNVEETVSIQCDDKKEFSCGNSLCIPLTKVCDGIMHCFDGSDESKTRCEHSASLLLSTTRSLQIIDMKTAEETFVSQREIIAMDYLYEAGILIWIHQETKNIQSSSLDKGLPFTTDIVTRSLKYPVAIAVDWIYYHIYWTDEGKETIEVADLSGHWRKVLIKDDIESPKAIALNPSEGLMFWCDAGKSPKIERCGLDGTYRQTIINTTIASPQSITIDFTQRRIYWADIKLQTISSANFDGSEIKTVVSLSFNIANSLSLAVYQDWMYWNDGDHDVIVKADKNSGKNQGRLNMKKNYSVKNILIYHPSKQPPGKNFCAPKNGNCSHICLPSPRVTDRSAGFVCACPAGLTLKDDGRTCYHKEFISPSSANQCHLKSEFDCGQSQCIPFSQVCDGIYQCADGSDELNCSATLIFGNKDDIRSLVIETQEEMIIIDDLKDVFGLDYLLSARSLFWTDRGAKRIQSAPIDKGEPITDIIIEDIMMPESIAVDWIYSHIYWTDREKKSIEVADLTGIMRKVLILDDVDKPIDIALNPMEGWMFWSDWGTAAKIERCQMDGTQREIIVGTSVRWPDGITIDFNLKKIYWCDGMMDTINSANFDGSERRLILSFPTAYQYAASIAEYKDSIFWAEWISDTIHRVDKTTGRNVTRVINKNYNELRAIKLFHPSKQPPGKNYCAPNNGYCSHFCFPIRRTSDQPLGYACACPTNMILKDDNRTCTATKVTGVFCNSPNAPVNGQLIPFREKYAHKEHVKIVCNDGFTLFGSNFTMCNNGNWNNVTCFCEKNLLYKQKINIRKNNVEFIPCQEKITDGNPLSCISKTISTRSTIVLNLQANVIIQNVTLTMQFPHGSIMEDSLNLMLEVSNSSRSSKPIICKLTTKDQNGNDGIVEVWCNGNSISCQLIRVTLIAVGNVPIQIQLCELSVFTINPILQRNTKEACTVVERSPNCRINEVIDYIGNQYILYSPKDGYHLKGESLRKCENGYWSDKPPQCLNLSTVADSIQFSAKAHRIEVTNPDKNYKISFILLATGLALSFTVFVLYKICWKRTETTKNQIFRIIKKDRGMRSMDSVTELVQDLEEADNEIEEKTDNAFPL